MVEGQQLGRGEASGNLIRKKAATILKRRCSPRDSRCPGHYGQAQPPAASGQTGPEVRGLFLRSDVLAGRGDPELEMIIFCFGDRFLEVGIFCPEANQNARPGRNGEPVPALGAPPQDHEWLRFCHTESQELSSAHFSVRGG